MFRRGSAGPNPRSQNPESEEELRADGGIWEEACISPRKCGGIWCCACASHLAGSVWVPLDQFRTTSVHKSKFALASVRMF